MPTRRVAFAASATAVPYTPRDKAVDLIRIVEGPVVFHSHYDPGLNRSFPCAGDEGELCPLCERMSANRLARSERFAVKIAHLTRTSPRKDRTVAGWRIWRFGPAVYGRLSDLAGTCDLTTTDLEIGCINAKYRDLELTAVPDSDAFGDMEDFFEDEFSLEKATRTPTCEQLSAMHKLAWRERST